MQGLDRIRLTCFLMHEVQVSPFIKHVLIQVSNFIRHVHEFYSKGSEYTMNFGENGGLSRCNL